MKYQTNKFMYDPYPRAQLLNPTETATATAKPRDSGRQKPRKHV